MWQILLLTAGFLVLVAVSVACVLFVNKAREDELMGVLQVDEATAIRIVSDRFVRGASRSACSRASISLLRNGVDVSARATASRYASYAARRHSAHGRWPAARDTASSWKKSGV